MIDLAIQYEETLSDPQTTAERHLYRQPYDSEYSRKREGFRIVWTPAIHSDPVTVAAARRTRWLTGVYAREARRDGRRESARLSARRRPACAAGSRRGPRPRA